MRRQAKTDHVFLYRNAPPSKDLIRSRFKTIGKRIGMKVYPHRLRHTCGTQLLNAGCRITSIQRFLGHKKLSTTMVYARANDKNVAQDYFSAMERVEKRLNTVPDAQKSVKNGSIVNVQGQNHLFELTEQLARPVLGDEERLALVGQLREALGVVG